MAKGFKIVTGSAQEVSEEVTAHQADGWLLRGELLYTHVPKEVRDVGMDMVAPLPPNPRFAQALVLKEEPPETPIERSSSGR